MLLPADLREHRDLPSMLRYVFIDLNSSEMLAKTFSNQFQGAMLS